MRYSDGPSIRYNGSNSQWFPIFTGKGACYKVQWSVESRKYFFVFFNIKNVYFNWFHELTSIRFKDIEGTLVDFEKNKVQCQKCLITGLYYPLSAF